MAVHPSNVILGLIVLVVFLTGLVGLWFDRCGRPRRIIHVLWWLVAVLVMALWLWQWPLSHDEVYYLSSSWAEQHGETNRTLPMRHLVFAPFLYLGLKPSVCIMLGRVSMSLLAVLCSLAVLRMTHAYDKLGQMHHIAGALALLAMSQVVNMFTLRPEYIACTLVLGGIWMLIKRQEGQAGYTAVFLSFLTFATAVMLTPRQALFIPAGYLAVLVEPHGLKRCNAISFATLGAFVGIIPSAVYMALRSSFSAVYDWTLKIPLAIGILEMGQGFTFPPLLLLLSIGGCVWLFRNRTELRGVKSLIIFWIAATASVYWMPIPFPYATGVWFALSLIAAGVLLSELISRRRVATVLVALLGLSFLWQPAGLLASTELFGMRIAERSSQFRLIDWLWEISDGGPVACVPPYHPIMVSDAWDMAEGVRYSMVHNTPILRKLNPDYEDVFCSGQAVVIQWDPWPGYSGEANILAHAASRGLISEKRISNVAECLRRQYKLVQWKEVLPEYWFGGGRFLVRREAKLDSRVELLPDSVILGWRDDK